MLYVIGLGTVWVTQRSEVHKKTLTMSSTLHKPFYFYGSYDTRMFFLHVQATVPPHVAPGEVFALDVEEVFHLAHGFCVPARQQHERRQ